VVVVGFEVVVETDVVFVVETLVDLEVVEALVVVAELGKHCDRIYLVRAIPVIRTSSYLTVEIIGECAGGAVDTNGVASVTLACKRDSSEMKFWTRD
jgi:hypothetical protein